MSELKNCDSWAMSLSQASLSCSTSVKPFSKSTKCFLSSEMLHINICKSSMMVCGKETNKGFLISLFLFYKHAYKKNWRLLAICEILLLPLDHNINIFLPQCNIIYILALLFKKDLMLNLQIAVHNYTLLAQWLEHFSSYHDIICHSSISVLAQTFFF
jgi:hypothetical protein